ncbi:MAG: purine-binding chemotaxis protein CheW [Oscillospiraceae bacterium]|nr:purine-binding chemotaxis protein CheW [Oscillospiraceae bacterium]
MSTGNSVETLKNRYLTFPLGEDILAIEIQNIVEIIGMQTMTKVPDAPEYIEGVINLRGQPVPIVNVRNKFNLEPIEYDSKTSIIVLNIEDISVGLTVDAVHDVVSIKDSEMSPYTKKGRYDDFEYIRAIAMVKEETILFVDCQKLLGIDSTGKGDVAGA